MKRSLHRTALSVMTALACITTGVAPAMADNAAKGPTQKVIEATLKMQNRPCEDFNSLSGKGYTHDDIVNATLNSRTYKNQGINPTILRALGEATAARAATCGYLSTTISGGNTNNNNNPQPINNRTNIDDSGSSDMSVGSLIGIIVTIGTIGAVIANAAQQYGFIPKPK